MKTYLSLLSLVLVFTFSGCASLQQADVNSKEKSLVAAGFQARPVPANKQALFAKLTPYKLQMKDHKGAVVYLYPDPKKNVCYVGGPAQYSAYRKLVNSQELLAQEQMSDMEWNTWGPGSLGPGFAPATFGGVPNRTY